MKIYVSYAFLFFIIISNAQNINEIKLKANNGDVNSQYSLAELYKEKSDSISDKKKAFKWALKSAKQGHEKAQVMLGNFYAYEPEVVDKDIDKAISWFKKAAKQNYCEAYNSLGWVYSGEYKDDKSLKVALDWFNKGIDLNCLTTMSALGSTYLLDERLPNRLNNGIMWLEKAANLNDAYAQYELGNLYAEPEFSSEGLDIKVDIKKAIYWYEMAAANKDDLSMYLLATIFSDEKNTEVYDLKKANYWYEKAAKLGDANCQYHIGLNLFNGHGIKKNIEQGLKYLRLSGYNDNYLAQEALGIIYCSGLNVEKDTRVGWFWLNKLIENDDEFAETRVIDIAESYLKSDTKFAIDLYTKSAENGNGIAQNNLAVIYINAEVVPQNLEKARYWVNLALENDIDIAKENLKIINYLEEEGIVFDKETK